MKILLTNDDGYNASGIQALHTELKLKHEVMLVAPDTEKSAVGHGITFNQPLRFKKIQLNDGDCIFSVSGTPVDCVKLALFKFYSEPPDIIISGINMGANVGVHINYSGTVGAVREAALNGLLGIAVSINQGKVMDFHGISQFLTLNLPLIHKNGLPFGTFLNINAPAVSFNDIHGIKITKQANNNVENEFAKRIDPNGGNYYWYDSLKLVIGELDTDIYALDKGYISVTPIQCDVTDYNTLAKLEMLQLHKG